jgi:flagellar motility protein MotE (MotC chaperone)
LAATALRQELGIARQQEKESPGGERARLDQLAADIARAREALRQETVRLQTIMQRSGGVLPATEGGALPIGDPLQPVLAAAPPTLIKDQVDSVAKAIKEMKPEQAAAILARIDRSLAVEILRRMRPADAGAVLGQLKPELAADLATELATRRPPAEGGSAKREVR